MPKLLFYANRHFCKVELCKWEICTAIQNAHNLLYAIVDINVSKVYEEIPLNTAEFTLLGQKS
jgi:hypothetical protein